MTLPKDFIALGGSRDTDRAAALFPEEAVETMVLAGNPDRVARQLAQALHPRITTITLRPHAIKGQAVADVVRAFAEQVVPRALALRGMRAVAC